jgi:HK97 family phage major capsid protein
MSMEALMKGLDKIEAKINVETAELRDRVLALEQKGHLPAGNLADTATGVPVPAGGLTLLRTAKDFRAHYSKKAGLGEGGKGVTLADFMRGVAGMRTSEAATKALAVGTDSAGGYSVPSLVMPGIMDAMVARSATVAAGAGFAPMDTGGKTLTTAVIDTVPQPAWRAENGAVAESEPAFRGVVTSPRSLSVMFKISRELLADAPNVEEALNVAIGAAYAKALDLAALRGSGTAPEPRGILNTTNVNAVGNGANGASLATTAYANFASAVQLILEDDAPMPTAAIMSPRSLVVLGGLLDTTNQPRQRPQMLAQMPFFATSQVPNNLTVGTSTDCSEIYVGDFTQMVYVQRENLSIELLRERYAENGQLAFMCHARVDVAVLYPKAFAVVTGVRP